MEINIIKSFLIWAGGFDKKILAKTTSSEINKMSILGSLVLIPAIIGMFSCGYAIYLITMNKFYSIVGGIVWSIIILLLDRSISGLGRPGQFSISLFGRLLLAISISLVIAEPVILLAFNDAIQEQQYSERQTKIDEVNQKYDTEILKLNDKVSLLKDRVDAKQKAATEELDGTGGSGIRHKGPIFEKKQADYLQELEDFKNEKSKIDDLITDVEIKRKDELINLNSSMGNGLLSRMSALSEITSPIVFYATWALRLFFLFIELIPFFIKLSKNGRGIYYETIDINDDEVLSVQDTLSDQKRVLLVEEEIIRLNHQLLDIKESDTMAQLNSKKKETLFLMNQIIELTDKQLTYKQSIIDSIKDVDLRNKLLNEIDNVFYEFIVKIQEIRSSKNINEVI